MRHSKKSPEATADEIEQVLMKILPYIEEYNVIKEFFNLSLSDEAWLGYFNTV